MGTLGTVLVGLVVVVGLGGALTQLYPGPILVLVAIAVWAVVTGGTGAWIVLGVAAAAIVLTGVGKFVLVGARLRSAGVPGASLLVGGLFGVAGFFLVPVVGLPLGFTLGVYVWDLVTGGDHASARASAWAALKAQGLAVLLELGGSLVAATAWIAGLIWA